MESENNQFIESSNSDEAVLYNKNSIEIGLTNSDFISIATKSKVDSGYSSLISPRNAINRGISSFGVQANYNITDSPATSFNSRNSALLNDEEMEEVFLLSSYIDISGDKPKEPFFYLQKDIDFLSELSPSRHSIRNSPGLARPESTPLEEEDEDSDKEASKYSTSLSQETPSMSGLPELIQCCTLQYNRSRYASSNEADIRNELIASKLREIADKLDSSNKIRSRNHSFSSDNMRSISNRHSRSSFADIAPCCGSAVDLFLSLYNVYKIHTRRSNSSTVVSGSSISQSSTTISQQRKRANNRSRYYTQ